MQLRPYQMEAIDAIENEFRSGVQSTLLVAATGTGKTVTLVEVIHRRIQDVGKKALVLAHRTELLDQLGDAAYRRGLIPRLEKADQTAAGRYCNVVVASVQSISQKKRLERFDPHEFSIIVTDEAHHSTSPTYRKIYDYFSFVPHLGVTATPSRHDKIGLKNVFETCAYQYPIARGIKEGYLVPIRGKQIQVAGIHLEDVKIVAGDFSQSEMDEMLRAEETLQSMVLPTIENAGERPTIVFTPGVEHAHEIAACFNRLIPNSARAVDGGMDAMHRREVMNNFKAGKFQFLTNCNIATEGFDHPPVACIALFRPTKSLGLFAQIVGRGTRLAPGKEDCLVLDFVGVNNTIRTLTVMDVLDGTILKDKEHEKAQELQAQGYAATEALAEAKQFVAGLDSIKARMRALSTSSAFDVLGMFELPSAKGLYGGALATEKQRLFLENKGIKCDPGLEKGEASLLIDKLVNRQTEGLATFKQVRYLKRLGLDADGLDELSFKKAGKLIGELSANGYKKGAAGAN